MEDKDLALGIRIALKLYASRVAGKYTPEKTILGRDIVSALEAVGTKITEHGMRVAINRARSEGWPIAIGYDGKGYFYALNAEEYAFTIKHLQQKNASIARAIDGAINAKFDMHKPNVQMPGQANHPVMNALVTQFELTPIAA